MILFPVSAPAPPSAVGRAAVAAGRAAAERALRLAARLSRSPLADGPFARDAAGAPLPTDGWHWSAAHTRGLAVAVVAPVPVGIDVEGLDRPRVAALAYLRDELEACNAADAAGALALWTAKEAALKLAGIGLAGLPRCTLVDATPEAFSLALDGRILTARRIVTGSHVLAVACDPGTGDFALAPLEVAA